MHFPHNSRSHKMESTYDMRAEEDAWVKFRTTPHAGHVPSNITTLVQKKFLESSAGKRKKKVIRELENIDGMQQGVDGGNEEDATTGN
jgi:hypothetical protein